MRIQTRGNSTTVWLSSGDGVINGTMSLSAPTLEKILQAVNEKYGTSLESWTQLPTDYEVGDTVPNWSAYEKIESQWLKFLKTYAGYGGYIFGEIVDNNFNLSGVPSENKCDIIQDGRKVAISYDLTQFIQTELTPRLESAGYNFNTIQIVSSQYEIGDEIPNWNKFTLIV